MPDFLDTVEGPDWLHDAINTLICGDNVTAPRLFGKSVALVTPQSLYEALAEHLGAQEQIAPLLTDNREYPIEQMICEIVAGGRRVHGEALRPCLLCSRYAQGQAPPNCLARCCRGPDSALGQRIRRSSRRRVGGRRCGGSVRAG